ncbi:hypothetical protein L1049_020473 [Liquidambar formosana]|uniref:Uncharacterized protein n=1 Tax=Liquidambar formosana TaxID=63359 RepID=A0AAP0S7U0_LIQFO
MEWSVEKGLANQVCNTNSASCVNVKLAGSEPVSTTKPIFSSSLVSFQTALLTTPACKQRHRFHRIHTTYQPSTLAIGCIAEKVHAQGHHLSQYQYQCQCNAGYSNLLNITAYPCYSECALGSDCARLGIKVSNSTSSSPASGNENQVQLLVMQFTPIYLSFFPLLFYFLFFDFFLGYHVFVV